MRALKALGQKAKVKFQLAWEWIKGAFRYVTGR